MLATEVNQAFLIKCRSFPASRAVRPNLSLSCNLFERLLSYCITGVLGCVHFYTSSICWRILKRISCPHITIPHQISTESLIAPGSLALFSMKLGLIIDTKAMYKGSIALLLIFTTMVSSMEGNLSSEQLFGLSMHQSKGRTQTKALVRLSNTFKAKVARYHLHVRTRGRISKL